MTSDPRTPLQVNNITAAFQRGAERPAHVDTAAVNLRFEAAGRISDKGSVMRLIALRASSSSSADISSKSLGCSRSSSEKVKVASTSISFLLLQHRLVALGTG